jgi:hypothetical protein
MQTPFGAECPFYYADFMRGKQTQRCDLLDAAGQSTLWHSGICQECPVPRLIAANACPDLELSGSLQRHLVFWQRMRIQAYCRKTGQNVSQPEVGCGSCQSLNPVWEAFLRSE